MLQIITVTTKKDLAEFIKFPWAIYDKVQYPYWVPPVLMDLEEKFKPKHPFYEFGEQANFLARRNGEIVGRISAIKNPRYNEYHHDKSGFFGYFECINEQSVANALLDAAADWLRAHGLNTLHGPASPSSNYDYGLLIEGFDDHPRMEMAYNPPYYQALLENYGLTKAMGLFAYKIPSDGILKNEKFVRVAEIARQRTGITLRPLNKSKMKEELQIVKDLYNKCWERNWGFVPMTDAEINKVGEGFSMIAEERLIQFAFDKEGKAVGMGVTLLDYNQVFKDFNGSMFPFNIFKLLRHKFFPKGKFPWVRVMLLGIVPEWRNKGLDAVLNYEMLKRTLELGVPFGEGSWILENNEPMNRAMRTVGGEVYKRYNVYEKQL